MPSRPSGANKQKVPKNEDGAGPGRSPPGDRATGAAHRHAVTLVAGRKVAKTGEFRVNPAPEAPCSGIWPFGARCRMTWPGPRVFTLCKYRRIISAWRAEPHERRSFWQNVEA